MHASNLSLSKALPSNCYVYPIIWLKVSLLFLYHEPYWSLRHCHLNLTTSKFLVEKQIYLTILCVTSWQMVMCYWIKCQGQLFFCQQTKGQVIVMSVIMTHCSLSHQKLQFHLVLIRKYPGCLTEFLFWNLLNI